jgi:hypothetical protein
MSKADDDMGPLPEEHPRERAVEEARRQMADHWHGVCSVHGLTSAERTLLLAELLKDFAARLVAIERRQQQ